MASPTMASPTESSIKDGVYTMASTMCSSLLKRQDDTKCQQIMGILDCVQHECKVEELTDFLKLVLYCVHHVNEKFCPMFAEYLNQKAQKYKQVMTPINLILRLCVVGLHLKSRVGDHGSANFESLLGELVKNEKILNSSPRVIDSWHICTSSCPPSAASECKIFKSYILSYTEALDFLCHPLAKSLELEGPHLVTEKNGAYAMNALSTVIDAFHALCQLIFSSPSFTFEKDGEGFYRETMLSITLAAFTLSIRTNHKLQENTEFIKSVITSEGIKPEDLKSIKSYLNQIVVALSKNRQQTEMQIAKVLDVYCKASWHYIICHRGSPVEGGLKKVSTNTLQVSVAFLDALIEIKDPEIDKKLIDTFENWSNAKDLFEKLPAPALLVRKWVVQRIHDVDVTTLYSRLSSSTKLSKRNIGIILEQELNAYEEMSFKYTERCPKMQIEITKILLQHIYITEDQRFQKAQTLVRQGKAFRACDDGLTDCIKCLSEAIIIMEMCSKVNPICHELGVTYCLRALCTQEAEPDSKRILEDLKAALKIWLSISCADCNEEKKLYASSDNIMVLLYNIIDLIELKGFMDLFNDAYQLLIRILKFKSVPVNKWLILLWESRRTSHALCVSPVNETFILNFEREFKEISTINFWIRNLQGNRSSLLAFEQNFSFLFANSHLNSCNHGSSFQTDITVEEVQKAALELISNVPAKSRKNQQSFVAGNLYRDLSQRLMTNGQLIKALSFAKEAHNLHTNLFLATFTNVQKLNKKASEFGVRESIALEVMLFDSLSPDIKDSLKDSYLSPWKILQGYLESTLQLGLIYEMMGDGIQAGNHFRLGRKISRSFHFPMFTFAFSYHLGGVHVKKRRWDSAENELQCAKDILNSSITFCCSKCKTLFEAFLYESYGNLCKSKLDTCKGGVSEDPVKNWYAPALQKLTQCEWRNRISCPVDEVMNQLGCSFSNMGCWSCIPNEVMKSGLLKNFINLKWEFVRRKLSMKLLTRVVNCLENSDQIDEWRKVLLQHMSFLAGRNPFRTTSPSFHLDLFRSLVIKEIPGDVFAIERAEIIQNICWYSLKFYHSKFARKIFCNLSSIKYEDLASWLMVAFVLAREVPLVFQKVSTLLALMYVVSASNEQQFSLPPTSKVLGEDYWSAYFHQASIGTHFTCKFISHLTMRSKGLDVAGSPCSITETKINALRLVPEATKDIPESVNKFRACLPSTTTVICISLLQNEYTSFLHELLNHPTQVQAWILVSRLTCHSEPCVMLMPLSSLPDDVDMVPTFKKIIKEDSLLDIAHGKQSYLEQRKNLDDRLKKLLRDLQYSFFGSWKCLLLGELSNYKTFDIEAKKLMNDLRTNDKVNVSEGVLKVILSEGKRLISKLKSSSKRDSYIAKVGYCDKATTKIVFNAAKQLMKYKVLEVEDSVREPVILILNDEVRMLPWENLSMLRREEVYRMPSVSSIFVVLDNGSNHKEQVRRNLAPFPSMDPTDAFYLLNPSGDLSRTQEKFEKYFRQQNITKGKAGSTPTVQELACALEKHDMFIYMGHGDGLKYIPNKEIEELEKCSAALLIGCKSCSITLRGSYAPEGAPLSYFLGGSRAIVGNLWDVNSTDIDRFAKALLDALFEERKKLQELPSSSSTKSCTHGPKIGELMGRAREACKLPFLTGASPVCYGVPIRIFRKNE